MSGETACGPCCVRGGCTRTCCLRVGSLLTSGRSDLFPSICLRHAPQYSKRHLLAQLLCEETQVTETWTPRRQPEKLVALVWKSSHAPLSSRTHAPLEPWSGFASSSSKNGVETNVQLTSIRFWTAQKLLPVLIFCHAQCGHQLHSTDSRMPFH